MLDELFKIIGERKINPKAGSYTSGLLEAGEDEILKKIGEEAVEVVLAAKNQGDTRLVEEIADLYYHTLVLLASRDLSLTDVEEELKRRHRKKEGRS